MPWLLALLVLFAPGLAHANGTATDEPVKSALASPLGALGLAAAIVLLAAVMNKFAPRKRRHMRRTAILFLFYLVSFGVHLLFSSLFNIPRIALTAATFTEVLGYIAVVNVTTLFLFDLGLPAIGVDAAPLLTDLTVGIGYVASLLLTLREHGVDLSSIVATSAVVTGVLALSMQATLGNVVGGIALQLDDSIHVGDWVQLENGRQGKVRQIRWRHTVIETRDWDTLIVPNAALLSATIMILGKRDGQPLQHRMWVYFNVDFRYNPQEVIRVVNEGLRSSPMPGAAENPPPECICYDFAKDNRDSFGYYAVRYWLTDLARDDPTNSLIRTRVYAALKRANIPLAVPAANVWVEQDTSERRERKHQREVERRIKALRTVEILNPLTDEEIASIADQLLYAPFSAGEIITRQGAVAHYLYIITSGTAEVRVDVDGDARTVAKIQAPGFFGEMGLMTGEPRTATVVAATDCECYRLDKDVFHHILSERQEMANEISSLLAQRRIELQSARENLDAHAKQRRIEAEKNRLLSTIQLFFGLTDDDARRRSFVPSGTRR